MFPNIKIVEAIRKEYPAGTRVRLVKMDDIQAPPLGALGQWFTFEHCLWFG